MIKELMNYRWPNEPKPPKRRRRFLPFLIVVVLLGYVGWAVLRPLPALQPGSADSRLSIKASAPNLVWPPGGQAAVGILGSDIAEIHGPPAPVPTASTAKIITALMVLKYQPITPPQTGPLITMTPQDVAIYQSYAAHNGSVVPVQAGEQLSEYQALQMLLLPSANNIADSLAIWAYGSLDSYAKAANEFLKQQGLNDTHVGKDASGLDPSTTSTAEDLMRLGRLAMQNKTLSQIVGQVSAAGIPVVNNIKNVNLLLGTSGIIGVKTGNSDQAGGAFVGASRLTIDHTPVTIVTAVAGAPDLFSAMKYSLNLINNARANFQTVTIAKTGQVVGTYRQPWSGSISATMAADLKTSAWKGTTLTAAVKLSPVKVNYQAGHAAGTLNVINPATQQQFSAPIELQTAPTQPSIWWRLTHPL
jgi:D-alanyl-D-alanine carboxypeptidase (penicillin-binding protein 5/6)